jgi:hypothetical protein
MAQWPAVDFIDTLKTALEARPNLSDVTVWSAIPGPDTDPSSTITLGHKPITGTTPFAALGAGRRDDLITLPTLIRVLRTGAGETVMKAVRDRAETIAVELLTAVLALPNPAGVQVLFVDDVTYELDQYAAEQEGTAVRGADLEVTFTMRIRVS